MATSLRAASAGGEKPACTYEHKKPSSESQTREIEPSPTAAPKTSTFRLKNPGAAVSWVNCLHNAKKSILYMGKIELEPTRDNLRYRFGIGLPEEIGNFAEKVFKKTIQNGQLFQIMNKKGLADFLLTSGHELLKEVARCNAEYGEFRTRIMAGWQSIFEQSLETRQCCLGKEVRVLSSEQYAKVAKVKQTLAFESQAIEDILAAKNKGIRAQLERLRGVVKRWTASLEKLDTAAENLNDPNTDKLNFYDFFKSSFFVVAKAGHENDDRIHKAVKGFYAEYVSVVELYLAYLNKFTLSAEYALEFYAKGAEAFALVEV